MALFNPIQPEQIAEFKRQVLEHIKKMDRNTWLTFRSEVFYSEDWIKPGADEMISSCPEASPEALLSVATMILTPEDCLKLPVCADGNAGNIDGCPIQFFSLAGAYTWCSKNGKTGLVLWLTWPVIPRGWPDRMLKKTIQPDQVDQFKKIVLEHVLQLDTCEWEKWRKYSTTATKCEPGTTPADFNKTREEIASYVGKPKMSLSSLLNDSKSPLIISAIENEPVYFLQDLGIYTWGPEIDCINLLDVWLSYPALPPNLC